MKKVFAPNGHYIIVPDDRVMTFGLTKMQNESVGKVLPIKECELYVTDVPEDLIAISASAVIINAEKLSKSNVDMMFDVIQKSEKVRMKRYIGLECLNRLNNYRK